MSSARCCSRQLWRRSRRCRRRCRQPPTFRQVQLTAVLTAIYQRNQAQSKRSNEAAAWQAAPAGVRAEAATLATWPDAAALDAALNGDTTTPRGTKPRWATPAAGACARCGRASWWPPPPT